MACDCFGYASASRRPVKRYNLLVPDVFPKKEPPLDRPVDATTERKFKRLFEYLQKTPSRGPKVEHHSAPSVLSCAAQWRFWLHRCGLTQTENQSVRQRCLYPGLTTFGQKDE